MIFPLTPRKKRHIRHAIKKGACLSTLAVLDARAVGLGALGPSHSSYRTPDGRVMHSVDGSLQVSSHLHNRSPRRAWCSRAPDRVGNKHWERRDVMADVTVADVPEGMEARQRTRRLGHDALEREALKVLEVIERYCTKKVSILSCILYTVCIL
jgi:hypothetical protein